jgi:hypothetical protein
VTPTITLLPPRCDLCTRTFIKRRAVRCKSCDAIVCRASDRACLALHQSEAHL